MQHNSIPQTCKYRATLIRDVIFLSLLLLVTSCPKPQLDGLRPLEGFHDKVAAQVTTSVRGRLRGDEEKQEVLRTSLPLLEQQPTMADLLARLEAVEELQVLAQPIRASVNFELNKPEHQAIKSNFNSPDVQQQVVAAIVQGMRKALTQLEGG